MCLVAKKEIHWLQTAVPKYFSGADFEIEILPAEGEEDILGVRVYSSLSMPAFHERKHALCKAMEKAGYKSLYETISIFQRNPHVGSSVKKGEKYEFIIQKKARSS